MTVFLNFDRQTLFYFLLRGRLRLENKWSKTFVVLNVNH